jgi:hypothetical protein
MHLLMAYILPRLFGSIPFLGLMQTLKLFATTSRGLPMAFCPESGKTLLDSPANRR